MDLIDLKNKIECFTEFHHIEILKILKKHNTSITENNNGSFINLSILSPETIQDVSNYVSYIKNQEERLNDMKDKQETIKMNFFAGNSNETADTLDNNKIVENEVVCASFP